MKDYLRKSFLFGGLLCIVLLLEALSAPAGDIVGDAHRGGKVFPVQGDFEYRAVIHCQWGNNWAQIEKKDERGNIVDNKYGRFSKVCDLPPVYPAVGGEQYWLCSDSLENILVYYISPKEFWIVLRWDTGAFKGLKIRHSKNSGHSWDVIYDQYTMKDKYIPKDPYNVEWFWNYDPEHKGMFAEKTDTCNGVKIKYTLNTSTTSIPLLIVEPISRKYNEF